MDPQNAPVKCCSVVCIGVLAIIIGGIFLGLEAVMSSNNLDSDCYYEHSKGESRLICSRNSYYQRMVGNALAVYSFLSALEVLSSFGLIWGVCKKSLLLIKIWLIISRIWILLHTVGALVTVCSSGSGGIIATVAVISVLLLGLSLLAVKSVLTVFKTISGSAQPHPPNNLNGIKDGHFVEASAPEYELCKLPEEPGENIYHNADVIIHNGQKKN